MSRVNEKVSVCTGRECSRTEGKEGCLHPQGHHRRPFLRNTLRVGKFKFTPIHTHIVGFSSTSLISPLVTTMVRTFRMRIVRRLAAKQVEADGGLAGTQPNTTQSWPRFMQIDGHALNCPQTQNNVTRQLHAALTAGVKYSNLHQTCFLGSFQSKVTSALSKRKRRAQKWRSVEHTYGRTSSHPSHSLPFPPHPFPPFYLNYFRP